MGLIVGFGIASEGMLFSTLKFIESYILFNIFFFKNSEEIYTIYTQITQEVYVAF